MQRTSSGTQGVVFRFRSSISRVRSSPAAQRMKHGPIAYKNAELDLELALKIDHFRFAMEVFQIDGELIRRAV